MGIHTNRLISLFILGTLFLSGCSAETASGTAPGTGGQPPISSAIHCPDIRRDDCGLLVTLNANDDYVDLNVRVHIDEGITFRNDYTEAVVMDDLGAESLVKQVSLTPQESRQILFPYRMNSPVLPGAYRVEVVASNANTLEVFGETNTLVFVYLDDEDEYHLLSSESEYANYFEHGFKEGLLGVAYNIKLEEKEHPHKGTIFIRITSKEDDYAPVFQLTSTGGITFVPDRFGQNSVTDFGSKVARAFPRIDENGTRLAAFPFVFENNGQVLEGIYALKMTLDPGTENERSENAPVAFKVVSDPAYREDRWVVEAEMEPYLINGEGGGGVVDEIIPPDDAVIAKQECETKWQNGNFKADAVKPMWDFEMSNFNGTLCQLFLRRYAGRILMNWQEFSSIAIQKNGNILSADQYLQDHEIYVMPKPPGLP